MKNAVLIFIALILVAGAYLVVKKPQVEIHITAAQIQKQLEKAFPYEKSQYLIVKTVFSNPLVRLENGNNRMGVSFNLSVFLTGVETLKSVVYADAEIQYDSDSKSVFLTNPDLKEFEIEGLPSGTGVIVRDIVGQAVLEILTLRPVYQIKPTDVKTKLAGALLKDIKVKDGALTIVLGI